MSPAISLSAGLLAPWALAGLVVLPVLWWLYRRRPRFQRLEVPSLQFFTEESGELVRRQRRALDVDLLLALGAAAALCVAAAGPVLRGAAVGRHVRVVVSGGAPAGQRGYAEGVDLALDGLRRALQPGDRLEVRCVPEGLEVRLFPEGAEQEPRPSAEALLAVARAGAPDQALVLSDLVVEAPDVLSIALGERTVANVGIVAADLGLDGGAARVLVTVLNDSPRPARPVLSVSVVEGGVARALFSESIALAPDEVRALLVAAPADALELRASLRPEAGDALEADNVVVLRRRALHVSFDAALPAPHRAAVERALTASVGAEGFVEGVSPDLNFRRWSAGQVAWFGDPMQVSLVALEPDEAGVPVPPGRDLVAAHPLTADLSTAGLSLVVSARSASQAQRLLCRLTEGRGSGWDLLVGTSTDVVLLFDVLRGRPPPADEPFWPVFIDNLVRTTLGEQGVPSGGATGVRRHGVLDPASTRLGRVARPFDPAWLVPLAATETPVTRAAAPWLALLGLVLLLWLWRREARRARVPRYA